MNHTDNYGLRKPENNEYISIDDLNYNTDKIDTVLQEKVNSDDGDISNTIIGALEESAEEFPVPAVKDKTRIFFGKVRKFIQDFNDFKTGILTVGMIINNAVTDNSNLPVSAAVAKTLQDQLTQLNSDLTGKLISDTTYTSSSGVLYIDGFDFSGYDRIQLQIFLTDLTESVQIIELSKRAPNSNYAGYQSYYRNTGAIFWTSVFVDFDAGYLELRFSGTSGSTWTREFRVREIYGFAK